MANNNNENVGRTLKDYLQPSQTATPSCIMFPPNVQLPEFKSGMIQLLPIFDGLENANPYVHIREFEEVVATFQNRANTMDAIKLREEDNLKARLEVLTKEIEVLKTRDVKAPKPVARPQPNPKGQHMAQTSNADNQNVKEVNAMIMHSGKEIDGPTPPSNLIPNTVSNKDEAPKDQDAPSDCIPMPFPQALLKPKERKSALKDTISIVNTESKTPLILGRPFIATTNALINCRNGLMTLSFGNMTLEVNVFRVSRQPHEEDECFDTYMIDELILEDKYIKDNSNSLEFLLKDFDFDDSYSYAVNIVDVFDKTQGFIRKS
ncbi:hypothetical protein Pint_33261 [Pistacia integerrima]|uniref:Uncharacterized protein n=1 Tax=Pistacia integerrima TaxID=434235 RepID=A0ACC0X492_9ROSI|nr:hypothetical protein Pint_33261 [Pistacia integerrima]